MFSLPTTRRKGNSIGIPYVRIDAGCQRCGDRERECDHTCFCEGNPFGQEDGPCEIHHVPLKHALEMVSKLSLCKIVWRQDFLPLATV